MRGTIPSLPQYDFMARCSVKKTAQDNFNFTFNEYNFRTSSKFPCYFRISGTNMAYGYKFMSSAGALLWLETVHTNALC
jgi:hypothetical protein